MDNTALLSLPLLANKQALQTTFHDEALKTLDALVMLSVIDRDLSSPPDEPEEGDRYIVKAPGSGDDAWADDNVVVFVDGGWRPFPPRPGWTCYVQDEDALIAWDGSAWRPAVEMQNLALLGVGTTADATNPFAAKLNNALWSARYAGEGGDGDLRFKLNKEAAGDTLSMLFQTDWSGRGEIGLTGDDNFRFKVSDDGTTWRDGIVIAAATGKVSFPQGAVGVREKLTAARTYYVRTDGSDSNSGLVNNTGGAFATIQKAINVVVGELDFGGNTVTIKVADGTYTAGNTLVGGWSGGGQLVIEGNTTTPANCFIDIATNANPFLVQATLPGPLAIRGFRLRNAGTSASLVRHTGRGTITLSAIEFAGNASGGFAGHVGCVESGARIVISSNITITGGGSAFIQTNGGGAIQFFNQTIVVTGTLSFSWAFAVAAMLSEMVAGGVTYDVSGATVTGTRYSVQENSVIRTGGGGASYFPGNASGSATGGGQYL